MLLNLVVLHCACALIARFVLGVVQCLPTMLDLAQYCCLTTEFHWWLLALESMLHLIDFARRYNDYLTRRVHLNVALRDKATNLR